MGDKPKPIPAPVSIYDEEFYSNLKLAKELMKELSSKSDKQICKKWIGKLVGMKSDDPVVKKNRNAFFKYLLSILSKAIGDSADKMIDGGPKEAEDEDNNYMSKWSKDKRTYIAVKPLPGLGTLVYMAVAKDLSLGWDHP